MTAKQHAAALAAGAVFRSNRDKLHGVMLPPLDPDAVLHAIRMVQGDEALHAMLHHQPAAIARALRPWISEGKVRRDGDRWIVIDTRATIE